MFKMGNAKEGGFVNQLPIPNDTNYDCWKTHMVSFLKSMNNKTWKTVINGWTPRKVTTEDNTKTLYSEKDWSKEEDKEELCNSISFNVIYNGVDMNIFRIINTCISVKQS